MLISLKYIKINIFRQKTLVTIVTFKIHLSICLKYLVILEQNSYTYRPFEIILVDVDTEVTLTSRNCLIIILIIVYLVRN